MDAVIEKATKAVASDVLQEAAKEVTGRSSRKWGVIVVALALGVAVGVVLGLVFSAWREASQDEVAEQGAST